ncbi:hypothetical protein E4U14_007879 [Claviceps sp. LM454 group G7]|nr:hypothetical protein E4U14_007879 [Claviceps sp. LM454 group G7]
MTHDLHNYSIELMQRVDSSEANFTSPKVRAAVFMEHVHKGTVLGPDIAAGFDELVSAPSGALRGG